MSGYPTEEVWPASLPVNPLMFNYQEDVSDQVLRSEFELGPISMRSRSAMTLTRLAVTFGLTRTQANSLVSFYEDTLVRGSKSFRWYHPRTGDVVAARFVSPPSLSAKFFDWYEASVTLETFLYIAP